MVTNPTSDAAENKEYRDFEAAAAFLNSVQNVAGALICENAIIRVPAQLDGEPSTVLDSAGSS